MTATETVEIHGIAAGGAGVGRLPDGRAVFVQRTAPGDVADVRVTRSKRRWATARLVSLRTPSEVRREAPCPLYERCGGCTLEHMRYDAQLAAKRDLVREALRRIGGTEADVPPVVPSPDELRYRNRLSFSLRRLGGGRVVAGFRELDRPDRILDVDGRCLLPEPALARAWGALRGAWGDGARRLPAGRDLRLTLRIAQAGGTALLVEGGSGAGDAEGLVRDVPGLTVVWGRGSPDDAPGLLAGEAGLEESWNEESVRLGGAVFLQVNRRAAALLESYVLERAGDVSGRRVVDAYCGVGIHARRLDRAGARVVGIEMDPAAVREARRGAPGANFLEGAVEDRIAEALPADLVLVNPPRAGLHEAVPAVLSDVRPERILYVSCDPATLARDVERLAPAFLLRSVRCFDLFPQTAHVETVAELECATS